MTIIDLLNMYHIMPQFPPASALEAEKVPEKVAGEDLKNRLDLTDRHIITIDGDDAKDFDDAVSLEILENKNWLLGVHIADVCHYVRENSAIDRAAFLRGTSVYLIDTVIPMLPFELSNGLCSLKPHEVRLALSVFMEITPRGRLAGYEIHESFIKSAERMTYDNVTKILDGDRELCERYSHIVPLLQNMKKLAGVLKRKRCARGAIEFVTHEAKITLDKDGRPQKVERYPITLSNSIIEEFMLACNETVAKHMSAKQLPCVYRVHDRPDLMRIERLGEILPVLGVDFEYSPDMRPKDFQMILKAAEGTDCFDTVNYLVLRTMSKAKYCEKNQGHFGLAKDDYCHFTSPIRRYPDLAVHRILKESLHGAASDALRDRFRELTVSVSVASSVAEINAAEAEMAWKSAKKAEYMADRLGEEYDGRISHITANGFFVELENTVEGFVAARTIEDDLYILDNNGIALTGMRTKRRFTVGDAVRVRVAAADTELNRVDFELVETKNGRTRGKSKTGAASFKMNKKEKKMLHELKSENREIRKQKNVIRDKADAERGIFESMVTELLLKELTSVMTLKRDEKRYLRITVGDMAAALAVPLYKGFLYATDGFSLKECLISAAHTVRMNLSTVCESFGAEKCEAVTGFSVEFVCAAMRHLDACLKKEELNTGKREHEYNAIAAKINKKNKSVSMGEEK